MTTIIKKKSSSGIGIGMVLFLIFLVLKLTGQITWSWWWVFAPLWIPLVLVFGFILFILLVCFINEILKH